MSRFLLLSVLLLVVQQIVAPPVTKTHHEGDKKNGVDEKAEDGMVFEYERYLKEVVQALESDPAFREKLEKAQEVDIRSGKIAMELEHVNHHVRTKLDEVKRTELARLNDLNRKKRELNQGHKVSKNAASHIDHSNSDTFEIEDLKKLIQKTNEDLAEADRKRKEEFKEYEMQKKFEEEQKMKVLNEEGKKKYADELQKMKEKHKKHQPLHEPGSKQQLEEVWEKQDHMEDQDFNPKTFFYMHDLDQNGYWDQNEVKTLFMKELSKIHNGNPEDDPREREEEMERMREHVFSSADTNHDGIIDYDEFIAQTKREEFEKDPGWKTLDEQEIYSEQEYQAFEKQREQEIQKLIAQGLIPSHPDYGHHEQFPPHIDPNQLHHQGQVPVQQQYQGHVPVQQQYQGHVPVQQQYQGHVPVQQQYQGQVPVQQQYQGQVPVQQQYQGQVPVQQYQGQVPVPQPHQVPVQGQAQYQVPQGQQPVQQQYQPPPQQVQPNVVQQPVISNQHVQGNAIPVAKQQQQPLQVQHPPEPVAKVQPIDAIHNASPNVVHT